MIEKLILSAVLGMPSWTNLYPVQSQPLTPWQLQVKAKDKSVSAVCAKQKKQSRSVQQLCKRWGKHE